jgi:hypothetical protein
MTADRAMFGYAIFTTALDCLRFLRAAINEKELMTDEQIQPQHQVKITPHVKITLRHHLTAEEEAELALRRQTSETTKARATPKTAHAIETYNRARLKSSPPFIIEP